MIVLDVRQQRALDMMMSGVNVYLTGYAGTGKTVLLREYIGRWKKCLGMRYNRNGCRQSWVRSEHDSQNIRN